MSAIITIEFVVPPGYQQSDYARLHGNDGDGDIDWDNPVDNNIYELFPAGAGVFGFGHAPWGHFRWGHAESLRTAGWGHLPWGRFPWGHGTGVIRATHQVDVCGEYKYGFKCYDAPGNLHVGAPEEASVSVHLAPPAPTGLKKNSYNKDTDVLVLDAA